MTTRGRQGDLFAGGTPPASGPAVPPLPPPLLRDQLLAWQGRIARHQGPLFASGARQERSAPLQGLLFSPPAEAAGQEDPEQRAADLDPLSLHPQNLSFWRWPQPSHQGAAVYLVLDRPPSLSSPLLLYVGETGRADRRWKGAHDCKSYLSAYGEALHRSGLEARLSIRFCCDVPRAVRPRRALEQALIRRWLPPFNKETRERWATPFTSDPA